MLQPQRRPFMSGVLQESAAHAHSLSKMFSQGTLTSLFAGQPAQPRPPPAQHPAPQHGKAAHPANVPKMVLVQGPYGIQAVPAAAFASTPQVRPWIASLFRRTRSVDLPGTHVWYFHSPRGLYAGRTSATTSAGTDARCIVRGSWQTCWPHA